MDLRELLTNEKISKRFKSQFDLVNYAIRLAENMISTGRDPRVKLDTQNRAMQILSEIANGKDVFDEIPEEEERSSNESQENRRFSGKDSRDSRDFRDRDSRDRDSRESRDSKESFSGKAADRKKARKIFAD
jgi:hypothetical protein